MGQRKSTISHEDASNPIDAAYDPYYIPDDSRLQFLPYFNLPPYYHLANLAEMEARLRNYPHVGPTAPPQFHPTTPAEYAAPSIYATPTVPTDQNVPQKTNDCKPCASDDQKRPGSGILENKGVEAKAFSLPKNKPERSKVAGAVTAVKVVNAFKQKSPKKILEKTIIEKRPRTQKYETVKKAEKYVSKERPETYVPSGKPERYVHSERHERDVPSVKSKKHVPSERSERNIPRRKSKSCRACEDESSSSDNDDVGDDDDDDDDGHSNVPRFIVCHGGSCCPASPQGKNLLSNELNWRQFRAAPPQMTPHHCPVSCHSYQQRFIDCNRRPYPGFHRCKAKHNSSFFIPNTPLTPVLCPPSSLNFGPGSTRMNVLDIGRNSVALGADGFCETIRKLADVLGPDDDKILDDVIDQLTSGNFK